MLLDVHLELGPPAKIVHYFEIVKEKWPDEEIPFAKIVKVGGGLPRDGRVRAELPGLPGHGREQLRPRERRGRLPRSAGRVPPQRGGDGPAAARVSAGGLRGRGRLRPGPAGLRQGPRGGRRSPSCGKQKVNRVDLVRRGVDDAGGLPDGLSRRSGRRPGRLRRGQRAVGPEGLHARRPRPATATPGAIPRATCWTATGT